jgi:hypothetical protein
VPTTRSLLFQGENLIQALAPYRVEIPEPGQVQAYLQDHPDLTDLLLPTCQQFRQEMGEQAELSLEVYLDPEIDDHYLTLYVRQAVYEPDLVSRIESVCVPFEEHLGERSGWLLVTTDFRPPRWKHAV